MIKTELRNKIKKYLDISLGLAGLLALTSLILELGFFLDDQERSWIYIATDFAALLFVMQEISRFFIYPKLKEYLKNRWLENSILILILLALFFPDMMVLSLGYIFPNMTMKSLLLIYMAIMEVFIIYAIINRLLRYNYLISKLNLHPGMILSISFASIVIIGTLLLLLPRATNPGQELSLLDSLFISTSAVCVTGLVSVDVATTFSYFGKALILLLIQVGGLGIMTLTTFFAVFLAGGLSIRAKVLMRDLLSNNSLSEVKSLLIRITIITIIIEFIGATSLYLSLGGMLWPINWEYFYNALFHSVSAFCNAGFSLYSDGLMNPEIASNFTFNFTIVWLIVFGGLGFVALNDIVRLRPFKYRKKRISQQFSLTSKIVISSSLVLLVSGAIIFYFIEDYSHLQNPSELEKFLHSIFLSVTARTAGFNTVSISALSYPVILLMLLLMWIGASPGSTGGGVKTTTFTLSMLSFHNIVMGKRKLNLFNRNIDEDTIRRSFLTMIASIIALLFAIFLLFILEKDKAPMDLIFEATSAISTVGLSRDLTMQLGTGAKIVIIALMFIGRIGVLNFFVAFHRKASDTAYNLPKEDIMLS